MSIYLPYVTFTDQDDIVPPSEVEEISTSGTVNTLAGDDILNGGNNIIIDPLTGDSLTSSYSFDNFDGTLNTNSGNDLITGL